MRKAEPGISPTEKFRDGARKGTVLAQRVDGGRCFLYPRIAEPASGDPDLGWVTLSGRGIVRAATTVYSRAPATPYNVAIVDLVEGPHIMSRIDGIDPDAVTIGMAVQAEFGQDDTGPILLFRPAGNAA